MWFYSFISNLSSQIKNFFAFYQVTISFCTFEFCDYQQTYMSTWHSDLELWGREMFCSWSRGHDFEPQLNQILGCVIPMSVSELSFDKNGMPHVFTFALKIQMPFLNLSSNSYTNLINVRHVNCLNCYSIISSLPSLHLLSDHNGGCGTQTQQIFRRTPCCCRWLQVMPSGRIFLKLVLMI